MLSELVGDEFTLMQSIDHTYYQPSGDPRPYVYALFKRTTRPEPPQ
ncbi:MAG: hypothetical protein O3A10_12145 [Chloroflexi bacterium]|nr:hypothetical protein [Chloroflexota bacterium]MDA1147654.1 hypothetical protein [Chloroflexota bacterium]